MNPTIRENARHGYTGFRAACVVVCAGIAATLGPPRIGQATQLQGSVVGWGSQVVGVDFSQGFVAVAAGGLHSLGLKDDGSIVAWGRNDYGQTNVRAPNSGFVAITAGGEHSLAIRRVAGDTDGDGDVDCADSAEFVDYLRGPSAVPQLAGWRFFDVDMDDDVDLRDFAGFQRAFAGQ